MRLARLLAVVVIAGVAAFHTTQRAPSAAASQSATAAFPGDTWQRVPDPTRVGWSKSGLDSVQALISRMSSSAMVVVEHGRIVYSYGDLTAQS